MSIKKFAFFMPLLTAAAMGSWSISSASGQRTASAVPGLDAQNPVEKPNDRSSDKGFSTDDFLKPDGDSRTTTNTVRPLMRTTTHRATVTQTDQKGKVPVRVLISTPHNFDQVNTLIAYPYPVKPPKIKTPLKPLPETYKELKGLILAGGYTARTVRYRPYPNNGIRWQACFNTAVRKSGLGFPHIISEMYRWEEDVHKYVKAEVMRSNREETARSSRYDDAIKEYDDNSADVEQEAVSHGRFPVEVDFTSSLVDQEQIRNGKVFLAPGKWWICGMHRVPGLKYYWQQPIEVEEGAKGPQMVELTEANALVITGAW